MIAPSISHVICKPAATVRAPVLIENTGKKLVAAAEGVPILDT